MGKRLVLARELELGHDEPRVVAVKLVDLPLEPAVHHEVPRLVDERAVGERQELARLVEQESDTRIPAATRPARRI